MHSSQTINDEKKILYVTIRFSAFRYKLPLATYSSVKTEICTILLLNQQLPKQITCHISSIQL